MEIAGFLQRRPGSSGRARPGCEHVHPLPVMAGLVASTRAFLLTKDNEGQMPCDA